MIPFRIRITAALLIAALTPLAAFGALLVITGRADSDGSIFRILLTAFVIAALLGIGIAFVVADSLTAPLRALATALDRIAAGDTSTPLRPWRTMSSVASRSVRTSLPPTSCVAIARWRAWSTPWARTRRARAPTAWWTSRSPTPGPPAG